MPKLNEALEQFEDVFSNLIEALREVGEGMVAGAGEEPDAVDAPDDNGITDDTEITMRSGDLREVVNAYRKMVRFARNGRIPTQDDRMPGNLAVRKVKHLIRRPKH